MGAVSDLVDRQFRERTGLGEVLVNDPPLDGKGFQEWIVDVDAGIKDGHANTLVGIVGSVCLDPLCDFLNFKV